jgi:flagellar assembly protein FliH
MAEVIKASTLSGSQPGTAAPRVSPFNFTDMGTKADTYLEQVRVQAAQIITQAKQEAEQIKAKAQQEGKQAALQAAEASLRKHVETQLNRVLPALESAGDMVIQANVQWQQEWNKQLVSLANAIAGHVIRREVSQDQAITLRWVSEALELGMACPALSVHLHPEDYSVLKDRVQEITARLSKVGPVRVVADGSISRGGCRVTSDFGVIDQTVEAQLARIQEELQ